MHIQGSLVNAPLLTTVADSILLQDTPVGSSYTFPSLVSMGRFTFSGGVTSVSFPALQRITSSGDSQFYLTSALTDITLGVLLSVSANFSAANAALTQATVDHILARFAYMDGINPGYAPGVGTQDIEGLTPAQAAEFLRAVGIQNELVAVDFLEYNPFTDDAHQTTGVLMDRLMRTVLGGIAARRQGITDPFYVDPLRLDHGVG